MVISMNARQLIGTVVDTVLRIVIVVAVVMFVYKYALEAYDFGYRVFAEEPATSEENAKTISIAITDDASAMDIGKVLEDKGLIKDARLFYVQEILSGYHDELKPGIYELSSDMTAEEMMAVMATVPEEDTDVSGTDGEQSSSDDTAGADEAEETDSGTEDDGESTQ